MIPGRARWRARLVRVVTALACGAVLIAPRVVDAAGARKTALLIGGPASGPPAHHDYPAGVRALAALLAASPDTRDALQLELAPDGWPDADALQRADTLVLWFDGDAAHPLRDAGRRDALERAMRRGAGLVLLHQASTVPVDDDLGLPRWLGATRAGRYDRSTEWTTQQPSASAHPVLAGVPPFDYRDEFYPTLRWHDPARALPLLSATLHPQFRDGHWLVEDVAERATTAWAYARDDGGRVVAYTGAHYGASLQQPALRRMLRNAVLWTAHLPVPRDGARADAAEAPPAPSAPNDARDDGIVTFHADAARSGWHRDQGALRAALADAEFGQVWESPRLASFEDQPPRLYASPLFVERLSVSDGPHRGVTFHAVIAATSNGDVYAINAARNGDVAAGRILWHANLGAPCRLQPRLLDGVPTGILATPVIDLAAQRIYVTHCDPVQRWQAFALDLRSGARVAGWPVRLDEGTFNTLNRNAGPRPVAPTRRFDFRVQRGALNLSPDRRWLYVTFGESETGWLVAVDTASARVGSAFATVAMPHRGSGGVWGAGGAAVDDDGDVYVATGSGFEGYRDDVHDWTQSVLQLAHDAHGRFLLRGTYTPFNHCLSAKHDIDLGSGGVLLLPPADVARAPRLLALGGKQGNAYLLDREHLPGSLERRPACSTDAAADGSLLAPGAQPQFGTRGPLNLFGPYSEVDAAMDIARARSLPALFRDADGVDHLYFTGNTRRAEGEPDAVPPSVAKVRVQRAADGTPSLQLERSHPDLVLGNPGSPLVTSDGARDPVVWILDENARRSALLSGDRTPQPVLYALDGDSLDVMWRSAPGALATSGKYNAPTVGAGMLLVGTDRIQAFGRGGTQVPLATDAAPVASAAPAEVAASASPRAAATLYAERCAICHEHAQGNIPPRHVLATRSQARIVDALTHGAMRPYAQGMSADEIERLARYLR